MVQIFLSYAREDEKKIEELYQNLSNEGFKPWMDRTDILPGENWKTRIPKAIRSSDLFVVCLTPNSVDKRGWIQREIRQALDIWQEKLDSDIYLIPARLEDCEVPESLHNFQWVNLFEEDGWTRLVEAIQEGMRRRARVIESPVGESRLSEPHPADQDAPELPEQARQRQDSKEEESKRHEQDAIGTEEKVALTRWLIYLAFVALLAGIAFYAIRSLVLAPPPPSPSPTLVVVATETSTPTSTHTPTANNTQPPTPSSASTAILITSPSSTIDGSHTMIIFADKDSLTVYVPANVTASLQDLNLEYRTSTGTDETYYFNKDFAYYVEGEVPPPFCLRLEHTIGDAPFPSECRFEHVQKPIVRLPSGGIFWWDEFGKLTKTLFVNLGTGRLEICDAGFSRCEVEIS